MKASEIAKILKLNKGTVIRWIRKGLIKATMVKPKKGIGGHEYWEISKQEVDEYLKKLQT